MEMRLIHRDRPEAPCHDAPPASPRIAMAGMAAVKTLKVRRTPSSSDDMMIARTWFGIRQQAQTVRIAVQGVIENRVP